MSVAVEGQKMCCFPEALLNKCLCNCERILIAKIADECFFFKKAIFVTRGANVSYIMLPRAQFSIVYSQFKNIL